MSMPDPAHIRTRLPARRQGGIAVVEFVVALPLLLLMLLAVSEFGQLLFQYNTLTKSTRDAARYLSQNGVIGSTGTIVIGATTVTETKNLVVFGNILGSGEAFLPGLATTDVTVGCLGGGTSCPGAEYVQVTAQYQYQPILGAAIPTFGLSASDISLDLVLSTSVVMRAL